MRKNSIQELKSKQPEQAGFSLIELMLVLAIILIVSSVAIPNILKARARANEASAASSVRAIMSAQNMYRSTYGSFTVLANLGVDYLTDPNLSAGTKSGFDFTSDPDGGRPTELYTVQADPVLWAGPSASGNQAYFGDQSNVIRFRPAAGAPADSTDPPLN